MSHRPRHADQFNNSSYATANLATRAPGGNTMCDTISFSFRVDPNDPASQTIDLGPRCACVADGSLTLSTKSDLWYWLDDYFWQADPDSISGADFETALATIETDAENKLNALSQPPATCWPLQHSQPGCAHYSDIINEQAGSTCYYNCQDGYFSRMGICTPSDDHYNGCGSVSLNHLWNGYTFLTFNFAQPDCLCVDMSGSTYELTPWSIQEIERVVHNNPAALKDAIAVFGSEAAVMFAVGIAAKTGLSTVDYYDYCYALDSWRFNRACPAEPGSFQLAGHPQSTPQCFYTCASGKTICGRHCLSDEYTCYDSLESTCNQVALSLPGSPSDLPEEAEYLFDGEPYCLCVQQGALTQQSTLDLDTLLRRPDALTSIQRPWPTIEAVILAATERVETELRYSGYWEDFSLPSGSVPACGHVPGAVEYTNYGVYFTCEEGFELHGDNSCIPIEQNRNTLCETVPLSFPTNENDPASPIINLGSRCACVADGSLAQFTKWDLQYWLSDYFEANPAAVSGADYWTALETIQTDTETKLNALSQPPLTCWPVQHAQPACAHASTLKIEQAGRMCHYNCEDGYNIGFDGMCTPVNARLEGCGSVPIDSLWNGNTFLTFNFAQPSCLCIDSRDMRPNLTPWSIQEIERVVYSDSAVLKDAVAVFGSEAAVIFAVTSAAKLGLSALARNEYCDGSYASRFNRACPAEPGSFQLETQYPQSTPQCFYTCGAGGKLCGRNCISDEYTCYDSLETGCNEVALSLPGSSSDLPEDAEVRSDSCFDRGDTSLTIVTTPIQYLFDGEPYCLCVQAGTLTQQSRVDLDTLFRQPDALASVQRPWPTIEAAILAATERVETEMKYDGYWGDFALPSGAIPACSDVPGAVDYMGYGIYFTCDEGLKPLGDHSCIPYDEIRNTLCETVSPSFHIQKEVSSTLYTFDPTCLCVVDGVLTTRSRNDVEEAVAHEDPDAIASALPYWNTEAAILEAVISDAQTKLNTLQQPENNCFDWADSEPACRSNADLISSQPGGMCYYRCRDGFSRCGGICYEGGTEDMGCSTKPNICGTIYLELEDHYMFGDISCACVENGELTPWTLEQVEAQIRSEEYASELERAVAFHGSYDAAIFAMKSDIAYQLALSGAPGCTSRPGHTLACPAQENIVRSEEEAMCFYTCNAEEGYSICGDNTCSQSCASGVPTLDRRRASKDNLASCPKGQTACYVGGHGKRGRSWGCLDTSTNIESCGGCRFPRDGQRQGQDCTEVDGANEISCYNGECQARSCTRDYHLKGTRCLEDEV